MGIRYGNQMRLVWESGESSIEWGKGGMKIGWMQYGNQVGVEWESGGGDMAKEQEVARELDTLTSFLLTSLKQMQSALLRYPSLSNTRIVFE